MIARHFTFLLACTVFRAPAQNHIPGKVNRLRLQRHHKKSLVQEYSALTGAAQHPPYRSLLVRMRACLQNLVWFAHGKYRMLSLVTAANGAFYLSSHLVWSAANSAIPHCRYFGANAVWDLPFQLVCNKPFTSFILNRLPLLVQLVDCTPIAKGVFFLPQLKRSLF